MLKILSIKRKYLSRYYPELISTTRRLREEILVDRVYDGAKNVRVLERRSRPLNEVTQ